MKSIQVQRYQCEVCGKISQYESVIKKCEKMHECTHEWVYRVQDTLDYNPCITRRCRVCKQEQNACENKDYNEDYDDFCERVLTPKVLEFIWEENQEESNES